MTERSGSRDASLPLALVRRIDEACNRFELAWEAGGRPRIEDALHDWPPAERAVLLQELIALEMAYRRRAGEQPQPEEYRARFPELGDWSGPGLERTAAEAAPPAPPAAGLPTVPGYEVLGELGRGGMGVVYQARQVGLERLVALKTIRAEETIRPEWQTRFRIEARAVARLQHPNIVQIYHIDEHDGRPYFSLELVDGGSLAARVRGGPWAPRAAARLVATLAAAVQYAHERGVLHRDLKPGNVLLTREGVPKITDFGLAKWLEEEGPTQGSVLLGTPRYMAPEQARGQRDCVGPPTDVFGLGVILYELLTGRPPYPGRDPLELVHLAREARITPPRQANPRIPRALERICQKALAPDLSQRYATAGQLRQELVRYLRRRLLVPAALAAGGLFLLGAVALGYGLSRPPAGDTSAPRSTPSAPVARDAPPPPQPAIAGRAAGAGRAAPVAQDAPPPPQAAPRPAAALSGRLIVRVWSPKGHKRGVRVEEPGALPVANGEQVHFQARLEEPAYIYLLWVGGSGAVQPLYPWDPRKGFAGPLLPAAAETAVDTPPAADRGWTVKGAGGLETALLLARSTPLPEGLDLRKEIGTLPATRLRHPQEVAWLEWSSGLIAPRCREAHFRDLDLDQDRMIDDPILKLMERLRRHFDLIQAVRFAHRGD
jgi:hypothetical protein